MGYHDNPENTPGEVIPGGKFDETSQGLAGRKFASESFFPPGQDLNLQLQWNNLSILFFLFLFYKEKQSITSIFSTTPFEMRVRSFHFFWSFPPNEATSLRSRKTNFPPGKKSTAKHPRHVVQSLGALGVPSVNLVQVHPSQGG